MGIFSGCVGYLVLVLVSCFVCVCGGGREQVGAYIGMRGLN